MTYFGFIIFYLGLPLIFLWILVYLKWRWNRSLPSSLQGLPVRVTVLFHILISVIYTTPWDNYLVATGVWWYDANLVAGITLGFVPVEEYIFFVVQTLLTSALLILIAINSPDAEPLKLSQGFRWLPALGLGTLWAVAVLGLVLRWQPGTYLGLILGWALPPMMLQFAFGGDILWQHKRILITVIGIPTLYLSLADSTAIFAGTWTIDPGQSTQIMLGGVLPLEEFLFFLVTNMMIAMGSILFLSTESHQRAVEMWSRFQQRKQID